MKKQSEEDLKKKTKKEKIIKSKIFITMINENKINNAANIIDSMENVTIKRVKKDNGLLERSQSEKIILVEDNRQVLLG